jgi:DNA replication licensing factor MCM3
MYCLFLNVLTPSHSVFPSQRFDYGDRIEQAVDDCWRITKESYGKQQNQGTNPSNGGGNGVACPRIKIDLTELRSISHLLEQSIRTDPLRHIRAMEHACHDLALERSSNYSKLLSERNSASSSLSGTAGGTTSSNSVPMIKVSLVGLLSTPSTPRTLTSSFLRQLVSVQGVATKVSAIKPKIVKSVHFCPKTKSHTSRQYVDATDPQLGLPALDSYGNEIPDRMINITSSVYPTKDSNHNPLETEFGLSVFKDHQTIVLQEMPEKAPMGQLPRSIELILDDDLVDKVKPGDRIQVTGVYRALATSSNGQGSTSGVFKTVVLVNHVQVLGRDNSSINIKGEDVKMIKQLAKRKNILSLLGNSLAPSIHGHDNIKKALALQLLGGVEKNLDNGTHLRGDVNILMVGDPSTAKSQLLRCVMTIAPLAVSTTGKGSSGVGLTAAVTSDPDTKEKRLEAGAMVLADRGIVCVDEFDKMSEADRVAIHEAMEQQTVTIAKAGIHAQLNARCSVLAAANPVYGQYDKKKRIQDNIGLPDSLLSRFDLLFVVLDQLDPDTDRRIASHVIRGHRYRHVHGQSGHDSDYDDDDDLSDHEDGLRTSHSPQSHSIWQRSRYSSASNEDDDILQHEFLRKYLFYAKTKFKPRLTEEARECIANRYAEMRSRQDERTLPVTARSLETVIRLATAHAKARLSDIVDAETDVAAAMDILSFALYHENVSGEAARPTTPDLEDAQPPRQKRRIMQGENNDTTEELGESSVEIASIKEIIWRELLTSPDEGVSINDLCSNLENRNSIHLALRSFEAEEKIMLMDGVVYMQ